MWQFREKKRKKEIPRSFSLSCFYWINRWNAQNLYIHTRLLPFWDKGWSRNTYCCFWSLEDLKLPRVVSLRQLWAAHSQSFILSFIQKPNSSDSLRQQSRIWAGPAPIRLCALLFNYCFLLIFEANLQPKDNKWQSLVALYHRPYCLNQRRCPEKLTFMQ